MNSIIAIRPVCGYFIDVRSLDFTLQYAVHQKVEIRRNIIVTRVVVVPYIIYISYKNGVI